MDTDSNQQFVPPLHLLTYFLRQLSMRQGLGKLLKKFIKGSNHGKPEPLAVKKEPATDSQWKLDR